MEFLAKHYEKLILGACLICLIGGIFLVANGIQSEKQGSQTAREEASRKVKGTKIIDALDLQTMKKSAAIVGDNRTQFAMTGAAQDAKKGNLFQSKRYILCKSPRCGHLIHISFDRCPFCSQVQDPNKDITMEDDTDKDGIPDLVEQKNPNLNYLDPDDAFYDNDNDGFLNIEEYLAKTDMEDPESFPPLALLLRVQSVIKRKLPFTFYRIRTLDSENKEDWKVEFLIGKKRKSVKFNEEIVPGYKVLSSEEEETIVTVEAKNGETYDMPAKEAVEEHVFTASMMYLNTRESNVRRFPTVARKVGEAFTLEKERAAGDVLKEYYKVVSGTSREDLVVGKLDGEGGQVVEEFKIHALDRKKDFIPGSGATERGGDMGEMRRPVPGRPVRPNQRQR